MDKLRKNLNFEWLDLVSWLFVMAFFAISASLCSGDIAGSLLAASGIIVCMFFVSTSISIMIDGLEDMKIKSMGTVVGFLTNGPEALCLLVGVFLAGDVFFAASTPLGSNWINPIVLVLAGSVRLLLPTVFKQHPRFLIYGAILCAALAGSFFLLPDPNESRWMYFIWAASASAVGVVLFILRPKETVVPEKAKDPSTEPRSKWWLLAAIVALFVGGFMLDPAVNAATKASCAPKGVIGFFVLATLTSWPEFRSTLTLLNKKMVTSAILNIIVSNVVNLWLAATGVVIWALSS